MDNARNMERLKKITKSFNLKGDIATIEPLGNGLINDTFIVKTEAADTPDYVLQRINTQIFTNVEVLQRNIEAVTRHIRMKLTERGTDDIDRRVLTFLNTPSGRTYTVDDEGCCWRMSVFIANSHTLDIVDCNSAKSCGKAFGEFESLLADIPDTLGETIPRFHDMELRAAQLDEAIHNDAAGRLHEVEEEVAVIEDMADDMCRAEQLHRKGMLPKRICHCDTKVNNMLVDDNGNVLCVIDLDTVMPSYVFSDYGDFLRTAANTAAEDEPDLSKVCFREDIFQSFTEGYIGATASFLTKTERQNLPFAVALFPYMQATRFLTDYLNGDTYYKTAYDQHNLVRTRNQLELLRQILERMAKIEKFIASI